MAAPDRWATTLERCLGRSDDLEVQFNEGEAVRRVLGLTGWAQVRYNYGSTDEDALVKPPHDLSYIQRDRLLLDVNTMLRTVGRVPSPRGA